MHCGGWDYGIIDHMARKYGPMERFRFWYQSTPIWSFTAIRRNADTGRMQWFIFDVGSIMKNEIACSLSIYVIYFFCF